MMDWYIILVLSIVLFLLVLFLVQIVRLFCADCDLQLQWAEKFGKSTGVLVKKVVWITGASSGIGEYLAYELAKAGACLILSARREQELERVKKECLTYGTLMDDEVLVLPLDMLKYELHKPAFEEVLSRFHKVDILINNAGRSQRALWVETDLEVDRQMLELNVLSVLSLTKVVLPHMIERKQGHIVCMSSIAGKMGLPGSASYSGAKHALQGWFNGLRPEVYEHNIKVTNICPGPVFSNLLDDAFTGKPGESLHGQMNPADKRMSTSRCAQLSAIAIANTLDEVWISQRPPLFYLYAAQYLPTTYMWLLNKAGMEEVSKIREGR